VLIPCILIFGRLWGLYGIVFATPAADIFSIVVTTIIVAREVEALRKKAKAAKTHQDAGPASS
jgi:Na+-driven multidrug efflux pump